MDTIYKKQGVNVKDIWLLYLTRNEMPPQTIDQKISDGDDECAQFFVFDYFDKLTCRRGDHLDHHACLGLLQQQGTAMPPVASHYLTLVSLEGEPERDICDPFFYAEAPGNNLSDKPFLSVVMVTILAREIENERPSFCSSEEDVNAFLQSCANELQEIVTQSYREWQEKSNIIENAPIFRVFYCANSGNFCIAVRANSPEFTYHLTLKIRGLVLNKEQRFGFSALNCSTFTITGMEYRKDTGGAAIPLAQELASNISSEVVLRFTTSDWSVFQQFRTLPSARQTPNEFKGLYGRYDMTVSLTMNQFFQIYPWICACKFNTSHPVEHAVADKVVTLLKELLNKSDMRCTNERILINDPYQLMVDGDGNEDLEWRKQHQLQILDENQAVTEKLQSLLERGQNLPYYGEEYICCLHLLQDLWECYSSLRFQSDSYINGNMFLVQIWFLLMTVENYLNSMETNSNQISIGYQDLLIHLRKAINSISHFQKLMQSVNQQSLQAPNYEVQMHTDLEKFVVAYTEFSRRFLAEHYQEDGKSAEKDDKQHILPILTVDIMKDAIEASPLFLLPYRVEKQQNICWSSLTVEQLMLSIVLPDIDTFGNLYATLPLICHELSHNFRVKIREERNDVLCSFILQKVAAYTVRQWISRTCTRSVYIAFGHLEDQFVSCLRECLKSSYYKHCGDAHKTANVGVLLTNLLAFLTDYFFICQDNYVSNTPELSRDKLKKLLAALGHIFQQNGRIEQTKWYDLYNNCYQFLDCSSSQGEVGIPISLEIIDEKLEELSKHMFADIATIQVELVMDKAEQLVKFVDAHYLKMPEGVKKGTCKGLNESKKKLNAFKMAIGTIYCDPSLLEKIYSSADEIDHWIMHTQDTVVSSCRENLVFDEAKETNGHSQQEIQKMLEIQKKDFEYVVYSSCRTMKDANHLFRLLLSYRYRSDRNLINIYDSNAAERKKLLDDIHFKLRINLKEIRDRQDALWTIYGSEQIQDLIAPLGIDLGNSTLFCQTLEQVLYGMSQGTITSLVNDSATLYREVFADIGMCVSLGLDVFGYLRVLSNTSAFYAGCLGTKNANMKLERMRIVCYAISDECGSLFSSLKQACKELLEEITVYVEDFMTPEGKRAESYRTYREYLTIVLEQAELAEYIPSMPKMVDFTSLLKKECQGKGQELYQNLQHLWNLVCFSSHIRQSKIEWMNKEMVEHFSELYQDILSPEWEKAEAQHPNSHVLKKIGSSYNSHRREDFSPHGNEAFKDVLSFVLYYYYHNWNVFSKGYGSKQLDGWVKRLIRGEL